VAANPNSGPSLIPVRGSIRKFQLDQMPEEGKPPKESVITLRAAKTATIATVWALVIFLFCMASCSQCWQVSFIVLRIVDGRDYYVCSLS